MSNPTSLHNVSRIQQSTVFSHIQSFLRNKGVKSKNTQSAYHDDLQQFFLYMRNKKLEQLTIEDLSFHNSDIMDYQTYLKQEYLKADSEHYSNTSINRKLASVFTLFQFLSRNGYDVKPDNMKVDDLPDDHTSIGMLSPDEIEIMMDMVLTHRDGNTKRILIMLAFRTSLRKQALLDLSFSKITKHPSKEDFYCITTFDKGKKVIKEIKSKMYELLMSISPEINTDKIFPMNARTIDNMMIKLCEQMKIPTERNISFHSIKKAGGSFVYEATGGDIYATSSQLSHANIQTSAKYYMPAQTNLAGTLLDEDVDPNIFRKLTHEQLLKLVEGIGNGLGYKLRSEAAKLIN